jgi:hypothetical protein
MKWTKGFVLAIFTSMILALMLSFLPTVKMNSSPFQQGIQVFQEVERPTVLNAYTIPDLLLNETFEQTLTRVKWEPSILTVDFVLDRERVRPWQMYEDLQHLVQLGFEHTSNVNEVLARVYFKEKDKEVLAVALIAKRDQAKGIQWETKDSEKQRNILETHFDLTYKTEWQKWQN